MSKHFQAKKESISYINKIYEAKSNYPDWEAKYSELEAKFK